MIDWGRIEDLQAEIGLDGFAEVVELFLDEVEEVVMRLRTAPDPATYAADLHFLKGGAWNLGFAAFGALCAEGERQTTARGPDGIDLPRIINCYFASKEVFLTGLAERAEAAA